MPDLPKRKVGIISCSGEELPEGTVSRVATRLVLDELRPEQTVTLCLPLFLAGDKQERAFARFYPTIAVDGCARACAAKATAAYSAAPAAQVVVTDIAAQCPQLQPESRRKLGAGGKALARRVAEEIAAHVDAILARPAIASLTEEGAEEVQTQQAAPVAVCACRGGGLPGRTIDIAGEPVTIVALDAILERIAGSATDADDKLRDELLQTVKVYNAVPPEKEQAYREALWREFLAHRSCRGGR